MTAACPRLRPLEIFPTEHDGERVVCLRDPSGLAPHLAFLPPHAALVVSLCDGVRTTGDVAREFARRTGAAIAAAQIDELLAQLDDALLLDSPRFRAHRSAVVEEFRAQPVRAPAHAGASYAGGAAELRRGLDAWCPAAAGAGSPPIGLIAPHIDFHRGGPVYGRAYAALRGAPAPELVIVFGTDHNGVDHPFTLTRKSYATPFGVVETDTDLVAALDAALDPADLHADELHHRTEHSIEFQAVWLRHLYGDRCPPMLPVLCGSLHEAIERGGSPLAAPRVRAFLETLRRLTRGRRVLAIAGADLAHVGPRFGDPPFGDRQRAEVERADRAALAGAARGDADAFFAAVGAERDRFRVCGLAPIFATLAYLDGAVARGELVDYAQCAADAKPASFVSIAAMPLQGR
jgi:AmmeMemoRadiSam system protein B